MAISLISVAIDAPLRQAFDYRAPPQVDPERLLPGARVWVPFGRRRAVGVILGRPAQAGVPVERLRAAQALIDESPAIGEELLELLRWSAEYYRHPIGEVIAAALPGPLRSGAPLEETEERYALSAAARLDELPPLNPRAHRLREFVAWLEARDQATAAELASLSARWRETLRELEQRGWVHRLRAAVVSAAPARAVATPGPSPSTAQQAAIEAIAAAHGHYAALLLHGVTGSGKTEVYLRAIEATLARGLQALVLVPEIALTPQLVGRFAARFPVPLAVLHSGLAEGERLRAWRLARSGVAPIVVGTRSAIFAPLARPGLIVVDEEHDPSFKQQEGFRYSARDLALVRAQRLGIPVVLGSATPSLESLERAATGRSQRLSLPSRAGGARPPSLALVDLRRHAVQQGIATPAMLAIEHHLGLGGQVLLYLNRRGYAPTLFCPGCGWVAPCRRCDARLTVHQRQSLLACHHCGLEQPLPEACPDCSQPVKPVGQGTERIEETLAARFPEVPLVRLDRDAVRKRGSLEGALARIASGEARLLVGTQMLTKGHDFPEVSLVVVLNADQGLFGTDFRASERLAQTIVQVAGRAGRAERPGEVLIQTEFPEHPLLQRLIAGGYDAFAEAALEERRAAGWPPFSRLAILRAEAPHAAAPLAFLSAARAAALEAAVAGVELLGPAPAPMERRAGRLRAQLLLQAPSHSPLQRLLGVLLPRIEAMPEARRVRWSIDVDPLELF
jgi:primosomal protein N' (replication factor Y)